ncbi:hypothetical protein EI94DRAFT_1822315 [Lactarius quietus]|nr:hypothetical protein EI94DRAFT_1822315 [Lactarius quietus]
MYMNIVEPSKLMDSATAACVYTTTSGDPTRFMSSKGNGSTETIVLNLFETFTSSIRQASSQPHASDLVCRGLAQKLISSLNSPIPELDNLPLVEWAGLAPLRSHNSFDGALATLAQEVKALSTKVDKPPQASAKSSASPPSKPATPSKAPLPTSQPAKLAPPTIPSFTSATRSPARPSLVVSLAPPADDELQNDTQVVKRTPLEITEFLNAVLHSSPHQVTLSAARWTAKNNLVLTVYALESACVRNVRPRAVG